MILKRFHSYLCGGLEENCLIRAAIFVKKKAPKEI